MPYNLGIGDIIQVSFQGRLYNQTTLNIRHYFVTTLGPTPDALVEFDGMFTYLMTAGGVVDSMRRIASVDWTIQNVVFQRIRLTRNARYIKPVNLTGSDASAANTANVAASVTLQTDLSTERKAKRMTGYVGRFELAAVPSVQYNNGILLPAYVANLSELGRQLQHQIVSPTGSTFQSIIFHRNQPGTVAAGTPITAWTAQATVRTQRTRTVGKGV